MITIRYDEQTLTMEITGHAGQAPCGQDIVCAAVSILAETLLKNLMKFAEHGWYQLDYEMDKGYMYIHCKVNGYFSMVVEMYRFTMEGMKMLAEEYGKHIKIEGGTGNDGTV